MNTKTIVVFNRIIADESVARLVDERVRRIRKTYPELTRCRVVVDPYPFEKGGGKRYRVRLYINQTTLSSRRPASPGYLEIHDHKAVLRDAVNAGFDKVEELLCPRLIPASARVA